MKIRRYRNGVLISEETSVPPPAPKIPNGPPVETPLPKNVDPPTPTKTKKGCGCGKKKP